MAYIGKSPIIGNFVKLDAITAVNGQAAYTMQNGGSNFTDYESVNQFLVSLNGTIQAPTDSFTVSGSTLTFASNLSTGDVIDFIMVFGNSLSAGTPTDATVTSAKLSGALVTPSTLDVNGNELILDADADTSITADTDDTIHVKTGGSDRVTVNDTGLAIGTTPEAALTVGSNNSGQQGVVGKQALFSGTSTTTYNAGNSGSWGGITLVNQDNTSNRTAVGITFVNRSTNSGVAGIQSTNDGTEQRADLRFITRGAGDVVAERMQITNDGQILMRTDTTSLTNATQVVFHPGSSEYGIRINSTATSGTQYHQSFDRGQTQAGYITSNSATTIAFNNASDERLKENIQNSGSAIQDLKDIKVRQFDWKDEIDIHRDFGFVAQELVNVVPEAVTQGSDELNENGKPVRTWGVDYSHIVPRLVKVCQEQQTKIEELEARITTLENA